MTNQYFNYLLFQYIRVTWDVQNKFKLSVHQKSHADSSRRQVCTADGIEFNLACYWAQLLQFPARHNYNSL